MIEQTKIYVSDSVCPYHNLALEEYLLSLVEEKECILYLWQNRQTVVIGRNQNAFKECKTEKLSEDGGTLARRLSGGGSVYHDMGNLNFTFLVREEDYNVDRQISVIVQALKYFGLHAEKTGRNDLCIGTKKFSGNAFYKHLGRCYHHGTILVNVDLQKMTEYLHVSAEKLQSNSVSSVKSRVVNLKDLNDDVNISDMRHALIRGMGEVYAQEPTVISDDCLHSLKVKELKEKYASDEWIYGKRMKADFAVSHRYSWGDITINLKIQGNVISGVQVFSDAMDESISEVLTAHLIGARFQQKAIIDILRRIEGKLSPEILEDIIVLLKNQEIW